MEAFRIANFALQAAYLVGHLAFMAWCSRTYRPTPTWRWFAVLNASFWLWVAGRFMETIAYLFFPGDGGLYVFAANFQYIGDTTAGIAFCIWNLHLAGYGDIASSRPFRAVMMAIPAIICILVFTNDAHHLIYSQLEMGPRIEHGPLFMPCFALMALVVIAGYAVAVRHILKTGRDKLKRIVVFSLYPAVPFTVAMIRMATGIDQLDFTPLALAVSIGCLYLIVFRYNYAKIVPSSIEAALGQTAHPLYVYDPESGDIAYANDIARNDYGTAIVEINRLLSQGERTVERRIGGKYLKADATSLPGESALVVTVTDLTDIMRQKTLLESQIADLERLSEELDDENRNIDAYLESLYGTRQLETTQKLISDTYDEIDAALGSIEQNLGIAMRSPHDADRALEGNLSIAQNCIGRIRTTVTQLKEAS